jgi:hypothetical protein
MWRPAAPARLVAVAGSLAAMLGLAWALAEGLVHRVDGVQERMVALRVPHAGGVQERPARAAPLAAAVAYVRVHVPRGESIYVTGARADLVTSGNPLFYVLAERDNPTRYDIAAPGVLTTAPVQREIVRDLERARPPVVVRWAAAITATREPNRAGRSSGVRLLDDYLSRRYRVDRRFGDYVVLVRD